MKKLGKVVSMFLVLVMTVSMLGVIGPVVSAAVAGDDVYLWPLYMEGVTGKGGTFDCYFGKAAQGKAVKISTTMVFNLNFPVAGTYNYELIMHNQWGGTKTNTVWLDDDTANINTHSYPSSPTENPFLGSLIVSTPGLHAVKFAGGAAIVRFKITGVTPVPFVLAGPADQAVNVVPESLTFDWTQNSANTTFYAVPNGAEQFTITVDTQNDFNSGSAYTKVVTAENLGITNLSDQSKMRRRAQYLWTTSDGALAPGTTYYWKVSAENSNGLIDSEVRSFTTLAGADEIPPTVGNSGALAKSLVSQYTAMLRWTKATDNISAPAALKYYIYRSESAISSILDAKAGTLLNAGGTLDIDFYLDNTRTPEMTYYYAVVVADEAGNEAMYNVVQADAPVAKADMRLWGTYVVNNISELHINAGESNPAIGFARIHSGLTEIEINLPAAGTYAYNARVMGTWANGIGVTIHEKSDVEGADALFFSFGGANGSFFECKGAITVPAAGKYTLVINGGSNINARERVGLDWLSVYGAAPSPFLLSAPADDTSDVDANDLTFDWTQIAKAGNAADRPYWPNGANSYTITVDTQSDFSSGSALTKTVARAGTSGGYAGNAQYKWVPGEDGMLAPNTTYYWKVTAINATGGTDSDVFSFTTTSSGFGVTSVKLNDAAVTGETQLMTGDNVVEVILNNDGSQESAVLIVALFNETTGLLESLKMKQQGIVEGSNTITSDAITVPIGQYTLKAFLWEDTVNIVPLANTLFNIGQ